MNRKLFKLTSLYLNNKLGMFTMKGNKSILVLMLIFLSLTVIDVSARRIENFSTTDAYDWLMSQGSGGNYNNQIIDTSAALLALDKAGGLATSEKNYIVSQMNDNKCWPAVGCRIKDTVWAMFALNVYGEDASKEETLDWLKRAQTPTLNSGNWWLQIETTDSGECTITYTKGSTEISKTIKVEAGTFPECGGGTFFDLKSCLEAGLLNNYASLDLNVDCSELSSAKIAIAYSSGSSYYLYQEVSESQALLTVKNGCFGLTYKAAVCDFETSLYAEWLLKQAGSTLSSELYLRENYDKTNPIHNALLYKITGDQEYATQLQKLQKNDGSWNGKSLDTALAVMALSSNSEYSGNVEDALEWLKLKQKEDGSWDEKVFETAMVLYAAFFGGGSNISPPEVPELPSCTDGKKNQGERGIDCGGPCEFEPYNETCCDNNVKDDGEEGVDCGGICISCSEKMKESICDNDASCEPERGEDCNNCPNDCTSCEDLCKNGQKDAASEEEQVDCGGYCKPCASNICNNNGDCEIDLVDMGYEDNEDSSNCPNDCYCGDGKCDDHEREVGCVQDCGEVTTCGDGVCGSGEDTSCPQDCDESICNSNGICEENENCDCSDCSEEERCLSSSEATDTGSNFKWLLLILVLVLLGGGAYYLFFIKKQSGKGKSSSLNYGSLYGKNRGNFLKEKSPKKPGPKGSFFKSFGGNSSRNPPPVTRPSVRQAVPKRTKLDEDIEESLREAKKLIRGEK